MTALQSQLFDELNEAVTDWVNRGDDRPFAEAMVALRDRWANRIDGEGAPEPKPWKIGDPDPKPFILVTVEGGLADWAGDTDRVEVEYIDWDISESYDSAIEDLDSMIEKAERIPNRLAELGKDDPRWVDKAGILTSLREDLAKNLEGRAGKPVFINDDGIVPRCDICDDPQLVEGDDWDGETGNHKSCEEVRA